MYDLFNSSKTYQEFSYKFVNVPPNPILKDYIQGFTIFELNQPMHNPLPIPSLGQASLAFIYKGTKNYLGRKSFNANKGHLFVGGQIDNSQFHNYIQAGITFGVVLVSFTHIGYSLIFNQASPEISNLFIDFEDVENKLASDLEDRLLNHPKPSYYYYLTTLEKFFINIIQKDAKRISKQEEKLGLIKNSMHLVKECKGRIKISELSKAQNISSRHLQRKFNDSTGLSPKRFVQIMRFKNILKKMHSHPQITLQQLVHDLGYFDQAHFIKDVKKFIDQSPSALLKNTLEEVKLYGSQIY